MRKNEQKKEDFKAITKFHTQNEEYFDTIYKIK